MYKINNTNLNIKPLPIVIEPSPVQISLNALANVPSANGSRTEAPIPVVHPSKITKKPVVASNPAIISAGTIIGISANVAS